MPLNWRPAHVELWYSSEDIAELPLKIISNVKTRLDFCIDQNGMALFMQDEKLWSRIKGLKKKGVSVRFVTRITGENVEFCRHLMKYGSVFHNDNINGNFQLVDGIEYLCYISVNGGQSGGGCQEPQQRHLPLLFHTNTKSFVNIQQYLFDVLCSSSIPARDKIKEIGKGIKKDFTDAISEPAEIHKIVANLLISAKSEILLLFSTANSFSRASDSGILNLLQQIPNDVTVKVLTKVDEDVAKVTIHEELRQPLEQIEIQYITKPLQKKIVAVVVDQTTSVAIEIRDDAKKTFEEASGVAIHSNSELTVSSCISIFETLWIESELDKQNKVRRAYFQMFKGLDIRDESYSRQWSFEKEKEK